jgi:hypothetical protein
MICELPWLFDVAMIPSAGIDYPPPSEAAEFMSAHSSVITASTKAACGSGVLVAWTCIAEKLIWPYLKG